MAFVAILLVAAACTEETDEPAVTWSTSVPTVAPREVVFPDGSSVDVEVVADQATRAQGLMFRPSLDPGRGMLFLFPNKAEHSFWMKNTLIPLDILWIDERRVVVHLERAVPPCRAEPCPSYSPGEAAVHVLEIAEGQAAARNVKIGDVLEYRGGIENFVAR